MSLNSAEAAGHASPDVHLDRARSGSSPGRHLASAPAALLVAIVALAAGFFFGLHSNVLYVESIGHVDCGAVLTDGAVCGASVYSSARTWMFAMWGLAAVLLIFAALAAVLHVRRRSAGRGRLTTLL